MTSTIAMPGAIPKLTAFSASSSPLRIVFSPSQFLLVILLVPFVPITGIAVAGIVMDRVIFVVWIRLLRMARALTDKDQLGPIGLNHDPIFKAVGAVAAISVL